VATRRDLLIIGGAAALVLGARQVFLARPAPFDFKALNEPAGFRLLKAGAFSGGDVLFTNLDQPSPEVLALRDAIRRNLAAELFGNVSDGQLPVAVFSDYNCPYCRVISRHLSTLEATDPSLAVSWHDVAFLGPGSTRSALAAYAAKDQGLHSAAHTWLMTRVLRPGPSALKTFAQDIGAEPSRLAKSAQSPNTQTKLDRAHALAKVMGVIGTPVTVVGQTIVHGSIDISALDSLIVLEKQLN